MDTQSADILEWDDFVLDRPRLQLRRGNQILDLEPKALRVLTFLAQNHHRVVSKDELLTAVWGDTFVTENALVRVIAQIRKQLGDSAREPRYIETAATVGYRFIAEVRIRRAAATSRRTLIVAATVLVTAIAAWGVTRLFPEPAVKVQNLRPLTNTSATEFWPAFSPDGTQVAFSSNRNGAFEIYVASLTIGSTERALTTDGMENFQPAWSPDGQYIAYVSRKRPGIWIVPVNGGVARQLIHHGDSPAWSPDGKFIAFREGALNMNPGLETSQIPGLTIWVVGADGSSPKPLTQKMKPPGAHTYPRWTPDGKHILFSSSATILASTPWVVDTQTGDVQPLKIDSALVRAPVISPEGRRLYFVGTSSRQPGVWTAKLNGFQPGTPELLIPGAGLVARDLFLSPDGKRIAFGQQTGESAIWSLRLAADGKANGEPTPLIRNRAYRNSEVVFSPDGARLAYASVLQGGEAILSVAGADGADPSVITHPDSLSGRPSWKGGSIGYRSFHNGQWGYFMQRPGGAPERLKLAMDLKTADRMRLSPDGTQLAADVNTEGAAYIVVEDLNTHKVRELTPRDGHHDFPIWSPDGRWLGVQTREGSKVQIAYMPATGGTIRHLNTGLTQSMAQDWSPDSDRILFAGLDDGVWNIYWISISTHKVEQLTHFTSRSAFVRYPTWSPKGDQIAFEHNNISSNIYIADLK